MTQLPPAGASKAFEPKGFEQIMLMLRRHGLVKTLEFICSDRDGATSAALKDHAPDVKHLYDAGHIMT